MWPRRDLLLAAATAATALHVLDDATLHREPGTTIADHVTGAGATLAVLAVAAVVFPRLRAGSGAIFALLLSLFALTLGGLHVAEITMHGATHGVRFASRPHSRSEQGGTDTWLLAPQTAVLFGATRILSPASPPEPLDELVPHIAPRALLLIGAGHGQGGESLNGFYYRRAGQPKQHWLIPEAHHTGGLSQRPTEYERREIGFFDRYL